MGAIKKAFEHIGHGIEQVAKGLGDVVKGVCTLDLKGIGKGIKEIGHGMSETAVGAVDLTPPALAANILMDGAADQILMGFKGMADGMLDAPIDSGLQLADGAKHIATGLATVDPSELFRGVTDATMGTIGTCMNALPVGAGANLALGAGVSLLGGGTGTQSQVPGMGGDSSPLDLSDIVLRG
ncbi:MAG TPA: hypothetical protein VFP68_19380 [Burkholderiaceae bacterium]|nr:hypothetical protein [Burkholderiaceae bacterium]